MKFEQVRQNELVRQDFREIACINKSLDSIPNLRVFEFAERMEPGIGRVRSAIFRSLDGTHFISDDHLDTSCPLLNILVRYNPPQMLADLDVVLECLGVNRTSVEHTYTY